MPRQLPLWIGRTDSDRPPPRTRLRVYARFSGICHRCGRKILTGETWDVDHVVALINGGANDESNLAPIHTGRFSCHTEKTAEDVKEKSTVYRKRAKHLGIRLKKKRSWGYGKGDRFKRKISGELVERDPIAELLGDYDGDS